MFCCCYIAKDVFSMWWRSTHSGAFPMDRMACLSHWLHFTGWVIGDIRAGWLPQRYHPAMFNFHRQFS
jgi:hypothetical protein